MTGPWEHLIARPRARRSGQILILTLLSMTLMTGLIFYVYNLGDLVNRRITLQNAADSTAISGASWMARSMNMVAMNNVSEARSMALVPVLDAIPLSGTMSFNELDAWIGDAKYTDRPLEGLTAFTTNIAGNASQDAQEISVGLKNILTRMNLEREVVAPMRMMTTDIGNATNWSIRGADGLPPHGSLWRSVCTLDDLSQSVVSSAGVISQVNADRFGQVNRAHAALLAPIVPQMPARRGAFNDYSPPLRASLQVDLVQGNLKVVNGAGGAVENAMFPYRLGPWANEYMRPATYFRDEQPYNRGWRRSYGVPVPNGPPRTYTRDPSEGRQIQGPSAGGGRAGRGASRTTGATQGGTGTWQPMKIEPRGYTTFGPYSWAKQWITDYARDRNDGLADTRFLEYFNTIADTKLGYMFAGVNPELKKVHNPYWITSIDRARSPDIANGGGNVDDPNTRVTVTRYYYIEVIYSGTDESGPITSDNKSTPVTKDYNGAWVPPERLLQSTFNRNDLPQITPLVQVDPSLAMWKATSTGTETKYSRDGKPIDGKTNMPVFFVWYFVFGGVDVGGEEQVSNPCNWDSVDRLPAPMLLDTTVGEFTENPDEGSRREKFTFLGVVRDGDRASVWAAQFASPNPEGAMLAVAQAKVFNNTSWDLWTQDWRAQLMPVTQWDDWVGRISNGEGDVPQLGGQLTPQDVEDTRLHMAKFPQDLADRYLKH